jgi:hypothetical protein
MKEMKDADKQRRSMEGTSQFQVSYDDHISLFFLENPAPLDPEC